MGDYEGSTTVDVAVDPLFAYLSQVENLPRYVDRMTQAHPATGDHVRVQARVEPQDVGGDRDPQPVETQAWFHLDADHRRVEWGADGPHQYRGELQVSPQGSGSRVLVRLHTEHDDASGIEDGIADTLANIERLAGTDPQLNPGTGTS